MESTFQVLLDLPDVRVLSVSKTDRGEWIIHVQSTLASAVCKRCGREIGDLHGLAPATLTSGYGRPSTRWLMNNPG